MRDALFGKGNKTDKGKGMQTMTTRGISMNRRTFIFGSAAAATLAGHAEDKIGLRPIKPGERRTVAMIGCGTQMRGTLIHQFLGRHGASAEVAGRFRIVAVCDCDRVRREAAKSMVDFAYGDTACRAVSDFREIISDPGIDAVCIATPDHWHAYLCVEAMKHGKDVYCEKPLTYTVDEARQVIAAQEKYGRVFQTGSMQRSWAEFRTACMVVRNGFIGDVMYVDANFGGPSQPARLFQDPKNAAKEGAPNPDVDWNMWLGPAKWRPYSDQLAPRGPHDFFPMFWRYDDDLASGMCGDWGAHHLDIAQWGLDADQSGPFKVIRSNEPYSTDLLHGGRRQCGAKMLFHKPYGDVELCHNGFSKWGTVFYGTKGVVAVNRRKIAVWEGTGLVKPTPDVRKDIGNVSFMRDKIIVSSIGDPCGLDAASKTQNRLGRSLENLKAHYHLDTAPVQLYKSPNQVQNFMECVETRKPTICPSGVGGRSAILCQLCNMSYAYDTGFDWDPARMDFANGTGNGISLKRTFCRDGWQVEV